MVPNLMLFEQFYSKLLTDFAEYAYGLFSFKLLDIFILNAFILLLISDFRQSESFTIYSLWMHLFIILITYDTFFMRDSDESLLKFLSPSIKFVCNIHGE